ncbi:MAG: putative membrane protein, partial [Ilumatobacter sp.]
MFAALASAAVTLFLGLIRIGRSFGYDEGFTYFFFISGGSPRKALTTQIIFNNHPMFSAIQSVGWKLGFVGETTQRLGPALCGAAAVGITVWFVARYFGVIAGVGAGVILGLNPVFLEQFRQLRGYALATVAVLAAGAALWRSWSDLRHRWLVIQGACMVVAVTTHAYSAVTILMLAVAT